jgi:hypothetical protein
VDASEHLQVLGTVLHLPCKSLLPVLQSVCPQTDQGLLNHHTWPTCWLQAKAGMDWLCSRFEAPVPPALLTECKLPLDYCGSLVPGGPKLARSQQIASCPGLLSCTTSRASSLR